MPLYKFTIAMPHLTHLNLSSVLRYNNYSDVLRAISTQMPQLTWLDISNSDDVHPDDIEYLLPIEGCQRGCPKLVYLNINNNVLVNIELLKKIILYLPRLQYLKHSLLMKTLEGLTEQEMGVETARCLRYIQNSKLIDEPIDYTLFLRGPVLPRLCNITEVDILVTEQSDHYIKELLMPLKKIKIMSLDGMSQSREHLLPVLESNGGCLEHLRLHDVSGNLNLNDIIRTCPRLEKLIMQCSSVDESARLKIETSEVDHVLTCLRKVYLQCSDSLCSEATLLSVLKSSSLEEIFLLNIDAVSDAVIFNYLSYLCGCYVRSSKVKKFFSYSCQSITEAPFVSWLAMKECMLEYLYLEDCSMINGSVLKNAVEKYPKFLSLFAT